MHSKKPLKWNRGSDLLGRYRELERAKFLPRAGVMESGPVSERIRTRLTADFFNALNHPVDVAPNPSTGLQDLSTQANAPRIIQFSLRVEW